MDKNQHHHQLGPEATHISDFDELVAQDRASKLKEQKKKKEAAASARYYRNKAMNNFNPSTPDRNSAGLPVMQQMTPQQQYAIDQIQSNKDKRISRNDRYMEAQLQIERELTQELAKSQKVFTVEACASAKRMKQTLLETKQENDELETSAESAMWKISMTELHTPAPLMGGQTPGKQGFLPSSIDVAPRPRVLNFMPPVDEEGEIKANLANKVMTNPFKTILRVKADAFGNEEFLPVIDKGNLLGDCLEEGVVDSAFLRAGHIAFLTKSHQVYHLVITQAALSTGSIIGDAVKTLMAEQPSKAYQVLTVTLIPFVGGISIIRARGNTLVALGEEGSAYMTRFSEQNPQTLEKPKAIRAFEGLVLCSVGMSDNRILGSTSTIPSILKFANLDGTSAVTLEDQESVLITELEEGGKLSLPKARVSTFLAPGTNSRCLLQGFDKSGESLVYWLKDEKGGPGQCVGKISKFVGRNGNAKAVAASSTHYWALTEEGLAVSSDFKLGKVWHSHSFDDRLVKIEASDGYLVGATATNSIAVLRPEANKQGHVTLDFSTFTLTTEAAGCTVDDIVSIATTESLVHVFATVEVDRKFPGEADESDKMPAAADD